MTVEHVSPSKTYETLGSDPHSLLVDVRTRAEWSFVGVPDLSEIGKGAILLEWRHFPDMAVNEMFAGQLQKYVSERDVSKLFFICRSGGRSHEAASVMTEEFTNLGRGIVCINVAEGFEGDVDEKGHRGEKNGWKAANLPWTQS